MKEEIKPHPKQAILVAIVGGSGAGKSWLAQALADRLGSFVGRLCLDDFYRDRSQVPAERRASINFDHPRAIDWQALEDVLRACREGRPCQLPKYDFKHHVRIRGGGAGWSPKQLVLVEGLWLLRRRTIRRLFDASIFVDCLEARRLDRRIRRDTVERGRKERSVREQFRAQVAPMHQRHVAPQRVLASRVVRSPLGPAAVERLVKWLENITPKS